MEIDRNSHVPYAQLPMEARLLLFFLNMTAFATRSRRCSRSPQEIHAILAAVWDSEKLTLADLDDSDRMNTVYRKLRVLAEAAEELSSPQWSRPKFLQ